MKLAKTEPIASRIDQTYKGPRSNEMDTYQIEKTDKELEGFVKERLETLYVFCCSLLTEAVLIRYC